MTSTLIPPSSLETSPVSLADLDRKHLIHPHQNRTRTDRHVFVRGAGSTVWDDEGVPHLDMMAGGNWVVAVGHGRPELVEVGRRQLAELEYYSTWREYSNAPAIELAARIAGLAPEGMDKVHFTAGGTDGTETAIKVARRFHHENGEPDRTWIIGRQGGYHGTGLASASVGGMDDMHYGAGPTLPHVAKVSPPMLYRDEAYGGQDPTDFLVAELEAKIQEIGPGNVAAMIGEPVMGGWGVIVPPADYWPRVREVLDRHGILLIADEVITGFGRTGTWFESASYRPDIIICAKGISSGYAPLGAVILRNDIGETMVGGEQMFFHGLTYSGHPLACALALRNIDLLEEEGILGRAAQVESWFREGLAPARDLPVVGDVRLKGAMCGIELVVDRTTKEPFGFDAMVRVVDHLRLDHRVLARDYGPTLVMGPPLVVRRDEVARACAAVVDVLSRTR